MNVGRPQPKLPVHLIGASAGTGKTHRLACAFVDAVLGTSGVPIDPAKILAVTFTNKAADELLERVRRMLFERGNRLCAQRASSAYIGTVNAICGRLLKEHAFEAGLSPVMNVIPDGELSNVLAVAADRAVDAAADQIEDVAQRLSYLDWRRIVEEIVALARSNAVLPSDFQRCSDKSWDALQLLLPAPALLSSEQLDGMLLTAIDIAIANLESVGDNSKTTSRALESLKEKRSVLRSGRHLPWNQWAQLTKLKTARPSAHLVQPVISCANNHARHPKLHNDIQQFIEAMFHCSAQVIEEYESFKRSHGFVDFTDQECLTLSLLDQPRIRERLSEKIELVLVDEFQDTSPIQLAVFSKLAQIAKHSMWVGDEKQAIYGFRGADPELMKGVVSDVASSQSSREQLDRSFRSRPSLIAFTNDLFSPSFESVGINRKHVLINSCHRTEHDGQRAPLIVCHLGGKRSSNSPDSIAELMEEILASESDWMIVDKRTNSLRPIAGADIAVLCRTNERCEAMAKALSMRGLKAACQRNGLLDTTECTLAFAALRYLVDRNDSLAMAEILHLTPKDDHQYKWLPEWLSMGRDQMRTSSPELISLDQARPKMMHTTPMEALETAISAARVVDSAQRWGNARTRLANLDALRGLAMRFEDICMSQRRAGTPAGLVTFLSREN